MRLQHLLPSIQQLLFVILTLPIGSLHANPYSASRGLASTVLPGVQAITEAEMMHLVPSAFLDTSGFDLSSPSLFSAPIEEAETMAFPMFPLVEKGGFFGNKIVGSYIPGKYLGLRPVPNGVVLMGLAGRTSESRLAEHQIRKMGLNPLYLNGNLLALDPSVNTIKIGYEYTVGFKMSLGFTKKNTLELYEKGGWNLSDSFTNIVKAVHRLIEPETAEKTFEYITRILPYYQVYMAQNQKSSDRSSQFSGTLNKDLQDIKAHTYSLPVKIPIQEFPAELQDLHQDLVANAATEAKWRSELQKTFDRVPVWKNQSANQLIQDVCDELATQAEMPAEVWPRCRIQASFDPNAFAGPGGEIFITAGLLGLLEDLDAVKYVLGHELGHVYARHLTHRMKGVNAANFGINSMVLIGNLFSLSGGAGKLGQVTLSNWFAKTIAASQIRDIGMTMATHGITLSLMACSRSQEMQSDRIGHQLALYQGADQQALVKGWQSFTDFFKEYLDLKEDFFSNLYASHPAGSKRLKGIKRRFEEYSKIPYDVTLNRSSDEQVQKYREIHQYLKIGVHEHGKRIKTLKELDQRRSQVMQWSLMSPGGQCALHALAPR